jgi:hypothetical protein
MRAWLWVERKLAIRIRSASKVLPFRALQIAEGAASDWLRPYS